MPINYASALPKRTKMVTRRGGVSQRAAGFWICGRRAQLSREEIKIRGNILENVSHEFVFTAGNQSGLSGHRGKHDAEILFNSRIRRNRYRIVLSI